MGAWRLGDAGDLLGARGLLEVGDTQGSSTECNTIYLGLAASPRSKVTVAKMA
jgi:hypothetical protein